ncbi:MAG: bifunctional nuclease family protein [Bacteroidota bacterium]
MEKIKLEIIGLSFSQTQTGAYALILGEENGQRRLPIIIGGFEAQAIAVELEHMQPTRPLTHDLVRNFAIEFNISIDEVIVYNLKEGIFFSKLVCSNEAGEVREIDARTSDAIAMAVRFNCPIYTDESILSQAGMILDENEEGEAGESDKPALPESTEEPSKSKKPARIASGRSDADLTALSEEELKNALVRAIDDEDYEAASRFRDELNRRKGPGAF